MSHVSILCRISLLLLLMLPVSCGSTRKINKTKEEVHHGVLDIGKGNKEQHRIIAEAKKWIGTPYRYGGDEIGVGADCSGFVLKVYENVTGIKIPRVSRQQAEFCKTLKKSDVEMGDLIFFATGKDPDRVSHVGIIVDDDHFIHASSSKGVVISKLDNSYFVKRFKKYGRVPGMETKKSKHKVKRAGRKRK